MDPEVFLTLGGSLALVSALVVFLIHPKAGTQPDQQSSPEMKTS